MYLDISAPSPSGVDQQAKPASIVWVASYPRSGNTFLRTVLYQCFGLRSGSVYPNDFGRLPNVESITGHIERTADGRIDFGDQPVCFVKTHTVPVDQRPAIYVVRDGRDAVVSLYHFWSERLALSDIVSGHSDFGSWGDHVTAWEPQKRPNTLLLRYEELVNNLGGCIDQIASYLDLDPRTRSLPPRAELAKLDGHWIRPENSKKAALDGPALDRFWEVNGAVMRTLGYA